MTVTPFPQSAMKKPPPAEPPAQPVHTHLDVPQDVRLRISGLHRLAASLHSGLGCHAATPTVLDGAEEQLVEIAERALALRAALVHERKRRAAV